MCNVIGNQTVTGNALLYVDYSVFLNVSRVFTRRARCPRAIYIVCVSFILISCFFITTRMTYNGENATWQYERQHVCELRMFLEEKEDLFMTLPIFLALSAIGFSRIRNVAKYNVASVLLLRHVQVLRENVRFILELAKRKMIRAILPSRSPRRERESSG